MEAEINEIKIVPFGEQLVGLNEDMDIDPTIRKIKVMFAEMAEILKQNYSEERSAVKSLLFDHAIGEIINANTAIEKVLTFKV
jgi:hypothetical protein